MRRRSESAAAAPDFLALGRAEQTEIVCELLRPHGSFTREEAIAHVLAGLAKRRPTRGRQPPGQSTALAKAIGLAVSRGLRSGRLGKASKSYLRVTVRAANELTDEECRHLVEFAIASAPARWDGLVEQAAQFVYVLHGLAPEAITGADGRLRLRAALDALLDSGEVEAVDGRYGRPVAVPLSDSGWKHTDRSVPQVGLYEVERILTFRPGTDPRRITNALVAAREGWLELLGHRCGDEQEETEALEGLTWRLSVWRDHS